MEIGIEGKTVLCWNFPRYIIALCYIFRGLPLAYTGQFLGLTPDLYSITTPKSTQGTICIAEAIALNSVLSFQPLVYFLLFNVSTCFSDFA